jgi:uncharacterized protein (DUF885 family)
MRWTLLALAGCATPSTVERGHETPDLRTLIERYVDETLVEDPGLARELGLHEHDGKIGGVGTEAVRAAVDRAKAYLTATDGIDPSSVGDPLRLDLELTRLNARQTVFWLEQIRRHESILHYGGLFDVNGYLVRDYAPLHDRVGLLLDHAEAATAATDAMLASLGAKQVRTHIETADNIFRGLITFYESDVPARTAPALAASAELKARYDAVVPAAIAALQRIIQWIADHRATATDDFALGEALFLEMLRANEGLAMSLADLEKMAREDFQKNRTAFIDAAKRIDPSKPPEEVIQRVMNERLPEDQVLATARVQVEELERFLVAEKIVTLHSKERCSVEETPVFMRWNSAFLDSAGPFEKAEGSFYYITPPDPGWPKDVQEQYIPWEGDLLATTIHEVYPGHFLHGLEVKRAPSRAAKIFGSYAFTEGWAHYAEQMMLEAGFGHDDPRLLLGQLSNALLRNCRFLAAIGLHVTGMTVAQADDLFQKECFIDPGNAKQQAYRGTFDPAYLSYTLGKLQILELRRRYYEKRGESLQSFHDWLLSFGSAPVAIISQRL